ncbi:MAG: hypothetical protein ACREHE_12220 [Rhizomicrobium sp.]
MARTIRILVYNRAGTALAFGAANPISGPAATAGAPFQENGETVIPVTVTAGGLTSLEGTFSIVGQNANFVISYSHPLAGNSTVSLVAHASSAGCMLGSGPLAYPGNPVEARANLYLGQAVGNAGGFAVPVPVRSEVQQPRNLFRDLANSMFGPQIRAQALIDAAAGNPVDGLFYADFTGGQIDLLSRILCQCWMTGEGVDAPILNFLSGFIGNPGRPGLHQQFLPLDMWVPQLTLVPPAQPPVGNAAGPAVYTLTGYDQVVLASIGQGGNVEWDLANLRKFLKLFLVGAHFVSISADADLIPRGMPNYYRNLYLDFDNDGHLTKRGDPVNSHYTSGANLTGIYYLDINGDRAPDNCGLILALLFGRTVKRLGLHPGQYNTFMQLEGWPTLTLGPIPQPGGRHGADYEAHLATLWNFSTFGACPYSEKRGATVFLAPNGWVPQTDATMRMNPYVGARPLQNGQPPGWLNTNVVLAVPPQQQPLLQQLPLDDGGYDADDDDSD